MSNSSLCPESVYFLGTSEVRKPANEGRRNMLRLIAYDVADSRRLRKVAGICKNYGARIEYSVFECDLDERLFGKLWGELLQVIDPKEDRLIAYRICADCSSRISSIGPVCRPEKVALYIM